MKYIKTLGYILPWLNVLATLSIAAHADEERAGRDLQVVMARYAYNPREYLKQKNDFDTYATSIIFKLQKK